MKQGTTFIIRALERLGVALTALVGRQTPVALIDGATITWNARLNYNSYVTLAGNRTLAITGLVLGDYGTIKIIQGGAGSNTLALPAGSKVGATGGGVLTLSTAVGAYDIATFYYDELGVLNFNITPNFT